MQKRSFVTGLTALLVAGTLFVGDWRESHKAGNPLVANAVSPAVPDYEVKFFLAPSVVLDSNNDLKTSVRSYFGMPSTKTKMSMQFLDTTGQAINAQGWNVRVRKMEDFAGDEFEVTYKKRYPIVSGAIDATLATAAVEGFGSTEADYDAQVEWGYQKQTLSLSNKKMVRRNGYSGMDLPSTNDSISEAVSHAPGKFKNWVSPNWGTGLLSTSKKYGPVDGKRWIGTWQGTPIYVEVWKLRNVAGTGYEYIVEASFKTMSRSTASTRRAQLQSTLTTQGWFVATDVLKTQMILDRY
jgi:hypothetical protein